MLFRASNRGQKRAVDRTSTGLAGAAQTKPTKYTIICIHQLCRNDTQSTSHHFKWCICKCIIMHSPRWQPKQTFWDVTIGASLGYFLVVNGNVLFGKQTVQPHTFILALFAVLKNLYVFWFFLWFVSRQLPISSKYQFHHHHRDFLCESTTT